MRHSRGGTILVTTLWILTILVILAAGIGFRTSLEARLNKYNMDSIRGRYFARAGVYKSLGILANDNNSYDSARECGAAFPTDKNAADIFSEKPEDGSFTVGFEEEASFHYGMMDEERKININTASQAVLESLLSAGSPEAAASIISWRGQTQVLNGAWDDYYKSLEAPYECKHAEFSVIEELMLVKGVTPELFDSIKDYVTVYGDGKININTATKKVLVALGLSVSTADAVIVLRNGPDNTAGTKDDYIFTGNDIAPVIESLNMNITEAEKALLSGNLFTTKSNYFRIESKGAPDRSGIVSRITCVADKGAKKLVYYSEH
jgi:general secretion pathway protein K